MIKKQTGFGSIELLVMFSLLLIVGGIFRPDDPFFMGAILNPYWVVVILIALRYGSPLGIIAGVMCAGLYLLGLRLQGIELSRLLHLDFYHAVYPFAFVVVGSFIGEVIQQHNRRQRLLIEKTTVLECQLEDSEAKRREMDKAYRAIERSMAGQTQTLTDFSESLKRLNTLDIHEIYTALVSILNQQLGFSTCEIWEQNKKGEYILLEGDRETRPLPKLGEDVLRARKTMTIRDLLFADREYEYKAQDGLIAGPLFNSEVNLSAVVVVSDAAFSTLTFSAAEKFEIFLYWASRSLQLVAADDIKASSTTRYSDMTMMSRESFLQFCNVELRMINKAQQSALIYCSLAGDIEKEQQEMLNTILGRVLRYQTHLHDAITWNAISRSYVLFLPATSLNAASLLVERMSYYLDLFELKPYQTDELLRLEWEILECTDETDLISMLSDHAKRRRSI